MKFRFSSKALIAVIAFAGMIGASFAEQLKLGYLPATGHGKFFVAKEQGFFDKEGLNLELIEFQNSANGLNAIIASAAILRTGIAEYFAANGKMPDDLIDLGYDHDWLPSNVLESIDVQTGGVVVLRFAPRPLREVVLTPDSAAGSIRGWDCESRDFPGIEQIAGCHFTGTIP